MILGTQAESLPATIEGARTKILIHVLRYGHRNLRPWPASGVLAPRTVSAFMPVGTEIGIWSQVQGEALLRDLPPGTLPFDRNFRVTDERTGSLA